MKVRLVFVPPGGGEADYTLFFDMPSVPQSGDYISVVREERPGKTEDFIVRRTWWNLHQPDCATFAKDGDEVVGKVAYIVVECEFARGHCSGSAHVDTCDRFESSGRSVKKFDITAY